jgi:hypothetical protein
MHELQEKNQWTYKECIELMTVLPPFFPISYPCLQLARSLTPDEVDRFFVQALAHLSLNERQKLKSKFENEKNQYLTRPEGDLSKLHYFQFLIILDDYMDSAAKWRESDDLKAWDMKSDKEYDDEWRPEDVAEDDELSKGNVPVGVMCNGNRVAV